MDFCKEDFENANMLHRAYDSTSYIKIYLSKISEKIQSTFWRVFLMHAQPFLLLNMAKIMQKNPCQIIAGIFFIFFTIF